jgi:hypothetical protein
MDPHLIIHVPWMMLCAVPAGADLDGAPIVDMVITPSSVDHIEVLAQMCDRAAEQLRASIRLDIPDYPPL